MKILRLIAKILILLVGLMMLMLSVDVFELEGTIWELFGAFFMHALPAIIVFLVLGLFWSKERILGLLTLLVAGTLFVFFEFYRNLENSWTTILIIIVPLVASAVVLLIKKK